MMHQGQTEGYRLRTKMQVIKRPEEAGDLRIKAYYSSLLALRNSRVIQEGNWSIPNRWDCKSWALISQQYDLPDVGGCIICTNMRWFKADGMVQIPAGVNNISVFDLTNNTWLNPDIIAKPHDGGLYINLDAWHTQVVFYE